MNRYNPEKLLSVAQQPDDEAGFSDWCMQDDVIPFLQDDLLDEEILIYASFDHVFVHGVLVPDHVNLEEHGADLRNWRLNPFSCWSMVISQSDVWIEGPTQNEGSETLNEATQLVFGRSFDGLNGGDSYFEVNQKIAQVLDVHFVPERMAWCTLDKHGDIREVIKIHKIEGGSKSTSGRAITFNSDDLRKYCAASSTKFLRMFDFTRFRMGSFPGWGHGRDERLLPETEGIAISLTVQPGVGSYSRGLQLVAASSGKENILADTWGHPDTDEKKYVTFIAHDWKNKRIAEISCNPSCLSNYFTDSDLPFEITPAFFRPEVLSKYKADREKYTLQDRSVSCRGSWHLETYDINEAGQVHSYLIYLSRLPYEEQLHWKQFNERPKAPLSKRAIRTDFDGEFYDEYDPLPALRACLRGLVSIECPWWSIANPEKIDEVSYPVTTSKDEWADEILALDQLLVEGLNQKWLRAKATQLGTKPPATARQLKLLESCLVGVGFEELHAYELMSPFHEVHNLRSSVKGHRSGSDAVQEVKRILKEFGGYKEHFKSLCQRCEESLNTIVAGFDEYGTRGASGR